MALQDDINYAFFYFVPPLSCVPAFRLRDVPPPLCTKDPFLGGGTVIVEALRAGRLGIGSDISPLALFVARGRTAPDSGLEKLREVRTSAICRDVGCSCTTSSFGQLIST